MGIIGYRIEKIEAKSGNKIEGEIKIASSLPKIEKIEEKKLNIGGVETNILGIKFSYNVNYEPIKGKIGISGELLYTTEDTKEITENWKKDKKLDKKIALPILNYILKKCVMQSIKIAEDLQLPPPIKLPEFTVKN
ncbi:MAG: hypothetical protein B6U88_01055 [Candidatus Aenigmarchaeota archaeon ex4484_56]|nr:MAG: hypothetical protein B6U88_01055 [Candidatus Aenigmarchaeota archaeon ex4484_56]